MRANSFFSLTLLFLISISPSLFALDLGINKNEISGNWLITEQNPNGFAANLTVNAWFLSEDITYSDSSASYLPSINSFVAVPDGLGLEAEISFSGQNQATSISIDELDENIQNVEIGEPALFKGIRVFPVRVKPYVINEEGLIAVNTNPNLHFTYTGQDNRAPAVENQIKVTYETRKFIESTIMNLDEVDLIEVAPLGRLLIVAEDRDDIREPLNDYIIWKTQQGYLVEIEEPQTLTPVNVNNLIEDHYEADNDIPLEYVLIVGDNSGVVYMPAWNNLTDHYYTLVDGNDILGDIAIGRFSVNSTTTLRRVVGKTLAYERDVSMEDTTWFNKACLTAGAGSGISPIFTNQSIKMMFNNRGIECDTLWYTMGGDIPDFIVNSVNSGVSFLNYRGLNGMEGWNGNDNGNFNNGSLLPVVVTITCGTGSFANEITEAISEGIFRAGTGANTYKGGVVCIGTATLGTHTRFNNIVDSGIFEASLVNGIRSIGWSLVHGKFRLYQAFNGTGDGQYVDDFSYWNNLMGDPALRMWIGVPVYPELTHEASFSNDQNYLDVSIEVPGGLPEFAWATLSSMINDELCERISSRRFNQDGTVRLPLENPQDYNSLTLTVMGDNLVPYQAEITRENQDVYISVESFDLNDGVNGDNIANPNENLNLTLTVHNSGTETSMEYPAHLSTEDQRIQLTGGTTQVIPPLDPGESVELETPVSLNLLPWTQDASNPALTLTVEGAEDYTSSIFIPVVAWTMILEDEPYIDDVDDVIYPGETSDLVIEVKNVGSINSTGTMGTLYCSDPNVTIIQDEAAYGLVSVNNTQSNRDDPFEIQLANNLSLGKRIDLVLELEDEFGAVDSVFCNFYVGDPRGRGPVGPDNYGYWAVDNYDNAGLFIVPEYDWIEISEIGDNLQIFDTFDEDDESVVVDLPFDFYYYGESYNQATICTNGWLAMGSYPGFITFRNWPIPNPLGPPAMMAVFWDDLRTANNGGVYSYHDIQNGLFIVQWNCRAASTWDNEIFQVILYDPEAYPTLTGNGRMKFQYNDVRFVFSDQADNDYGTVGIENQDQLDGVEYVYWNIYADGAELVTDELAILFTDDLRDYVGTPIAGINPDQIDLTVAAGRNISDSLTISNSGDGRMTWSISLENNEIQENQRINNLVLNRINNTIESKKSNLQSEGRNVNPDPIKENQDFNLSRNRIGYPGPPVMFDFGGPDNYGYEWIDSNEPEGIPFQWHSDYGDEITDFGDDPDEGLSQPINIPFDFSFYGVDYNSLVVCSNGYVSFIDDQTAAWRNYSLPDAQAPLAIIAPWWDDLDLERGGAIYSWDNGSDSLIITFEEIYGWNDAEEPPRGGPYTFQVLIDSNQSITMNYLEMIHDGDTRLDESTIGIQNETAQDGLTVLHNNDTYMEDSLTVYIRVPNIWLQMSSYEGMVLPGLTDNISVLINAQSLAPDNYQGSIVVLTNDENQPETTVPVFLNVIPGGVPPRVSDIPEQEIDQGDEFDFIVLDDYVEDENYDNRWIQWTYEGDENLHVEIVNRIAQVSTINQLWSGEETIDFIASNPEDLSDTVSVTFVVNFRDLPPSPFDLVMPEDNETIRLPLVHFFWNQSADPNGGPIKYNFYISNYQDTVSCLNLVDNDMWLYPDTLDFDFVSMQNLEWWITATDTSQGVTESNSHYIFRLEFTSVKETPGLPDKFEVSKAWPNPFNPDVNIRIALPEKAELSYQVIDILGRSVDQIDLGLVNAGYKDITWSNLKATSGVYFIKVKAGPLTEVRKVMMLK